MNIPLLEKIAEVIEAQPELFDMGYWHCETTHCIGGWAQRLSGRAENIDTQDMADLLGIELTSDDDCLVYDECEAGRLFLSDNWPTQFRDAYEIANNSDNQAMKAKVAADRIRHFIATSGRE